MMRPGQEKRLALALSVGVHVAIFGVFAAGGLFSFLQSHSQAPPVDVMVYNEDAAATTDAPAAAPAGTAPAATGGENAVTYAAPTTALPKIDETYTQAAQEARFVQQVMQEQGVDAVTANQLVAASQQKQSAARPSGVTGSAAAAGNSAEPAGDGTGAGPSPGGAGTSGTPGGDGTDPTGQGADGGAANPAAPANVGRRPAKKARLISQPDVSAYYPEDLRRRNITGTVTVHIVIGADGTVTSASVAASSGYSEMDDAAVKLAYQCRYEPAENEDGQAVASERNLNIPFGLV